MLLFEAVQSVPSPIGTRPTTGRAMGDGDAVGGPGLELGVAEIDRVCRDGVGGCQAGLDQAGERAIMAAPPHDGHFGLVLRDMKKDPGACPVGLPRALLQQVVRAGVEGMRGDAGEDAPARVGAEAFEHGVGGLPVGRRPGVDQRMADDGADARLLDGGRDAIHVAEPVGDAGDAVQQEFRTGGAHGKDVILDRETLLAGQWAMAMP